MLTPNVVPDFTALRLAVVGDVIADRYVYARPTRLSREAPVMVLCHESEETGAGGAANVARNLWTFGANTRLLGVVGQDQPGREVLRKVDEELVDVSGVVPVAAWTTPMKTRILGGEPGRTKHQMLRIDREPKEPLPAAVRADMAARVSALAGEVDALLLSDYGYGVVGPELADAVREVQGAGAAVVLDPRCQYEPFRGITAMTPNLGELALATGREREELATREGVVRAAGEFLERYEPLLLLVTMGNRGMALFTRQDPEGIHVRAAGSDVVIDVSGAGDTAASAFTLALAAGLAGPRAMRIANAASGVVVMELGATVCPLSKLRSALPDAPQPERRAQVVA